MALMRFVLFAVVLPLQFPLLNLSTRDRHDLRRYPFEMLEWRFFVLTLGFVTFPPVWLDLCNDFGMILGCLAVAIALLGFSLVRLEIHNCDEPFRRWR
jgi:hypothetical protein